MTDALTKMIEAADRLQRADDRLLQAIAMIASAGQITVIPNDIRWSKPVIHLPQHMYDRLLKITKEASIDKG